MDRKDLTVRMPYNLPAAGPFLRRIGLAFVMIAIVGGIVGMHGINGAPAASIVTGGSGYTAIALDGMAVQPTPAPSPAALGCAPSVGTAALEIQGSLPEANCLLAECTFAMAMHGGCIPTLSSPVLDVPLPGTLSTRSAGTAFTVVPGNQSSERVPDRPSLTQLSISQT